MSTSGILSAIWIKRAHRGPMDPADSATLVPGLGIVGNADKGGRRQVTIIEREVWEARTAAAGGELEAGERRANFMVEGISLRDSRGRTLRVGETLLEIRGETKPCEQMEAALPGLKDALWPDWGGGAYAQVVDGGIVQLGDEVRWAE